MKNRQKFSIFISSTYEDLKEERQAWGELFELTGTGYSKADWLKDNMGIDTSKEPCDELKEFES